MIKPEYFTLHTLFAERVFRIPYYQRFYSWQPKQRQELFNDLEDLFKKDRDGNRHHFMATVVCFGTGEKKSVKTVDYSLFEIVDGQQRITTLILMLKAIQLRVDDPQLKDDIGRIIVKDDGNLLLLQTNNLNQKLFNKYLREGIAPSKGDISTHSDWNIFAAVQDIERFLDNWKLQYGDYLGLLRLIRNRVGFVVYDTLEKHAVYTIFECLNSRGLEVDWLDKAKSMLMGVAFDKSKSDEVRDAMIDELHKLWAGVYEKLAQWPVQGQEILRVTASLYVGSGAGKPLGSEDSIDRLRDFCKTSEDTIKVTEWIQNVTAKLVELQISRIWAPVTRILQVRLLAVALMISDSLDKSQRDKALDQCERVSFRIYGLFGKDSRNKVGDYVRLAAQIIQKKDTADGAEKILDRLRELGSDYPVKAAVEELLKEPKYDGFEDEIRYILWRFEEFLAETQKAQVNKELREIIWSARSASETIEHVYPRTPEPGGPWENKLNGEPPEKHVDRMGNLLLLPPGLNSEASRRAFDKKKEIYKRAEGLRIVSEVMTEKDWSKKEIDGREQRIKDFLLRAFDDVGTA